MKPFATQLEYNYFLLSYYFYQITKACAAIAIIKFIMLGVYKHWTGLLEWWNSGVVE